MRYSVLLQQRTDGKYQASVLRSSGRTGTSARASTGPSSTRSGNHSRQPSYRLTIVGRPCALRHRYEGQH